MCAGIFSTGHLIQVAADQSHFPSVFSHMDRNRGTPIRAMVLLGTIITPMILFSGLMELIHTNTFVAYVFYGASVLGLLVLRYSNPKWKHVPRSYKVWPVTAILFLIVAGWMVGVSVIHNFLHAIYLIVWICFGFLCWSVQQLLTRWQDRAHYSQRTPVPTTDELELIPATYNKLTVGL
jgi:L-type amino acid transporter 9